MRLYRILGIILFAIFSICFLTSNASAMVTWEKTFGGSDYDHGWSVQQTVDGGYIIVGSTRSFGAANYVVYLINVAFQRKVDRFRG